MSASSHCRPWNSATALPNWRRSLGIAHRRLEPGLGDADRQRGDPDPALVEHAHHHVEAAALLAQQRLRRQLDAVEVQRSHRRGALAHLVLALAHREARPVAVDQHDAHAPPAGLLVGPHQHHGEVADGRVVDPQLAAIERASRRRLLTAVVRMPATSEPASASVMA